MLICLKLHCLWDFVKYLWILSLINFLVKVEPFIDISAIYNHLQTKQSGRRIPKQTKSLATICEEVLGISLSKVCIRDKRFELCLLESI